MLYRFAIVAGLLLLALASLSTPRATKAQQHEVFEDAHAWFQLSSGQTIGVGGNTARGTAGGGLSDGTFFQRPISEVDFHVDQPLASAHLSGTFNAVRCSPDCVPAGIFTVDVTWEGQGTRRNLPMGQVRKYEDCSATLNHSMSRSALASGTINGEPVEGTGFFGYYFYPPLGDCWGGPILASEN
jgi:hypothetical protein